MLRRLAMETVKTVDFSLKIRCNPRINSGDISIKPAIRTVSPVGMPLANGFINQRNIDYLCRTHVK